MLYLMHLPVKLQSYNLAFASKYWQEIEYSGFDKQQDVVNLFSLGGHSPACFWIGGYESDPENLYFTWNTSARVMDKYFIEWESGYPKNR